MSASRIPELDGVRGFAILSVLYWHYFACQKHTGLPNIVQILERAGMLSWAGVDLFFVLSGFLIGGILVENRDAPNLLRIFYVRRLLRIIPLYFAWLIAFIALRGLIADRIRSPWLLSFPLPMWSYFTFTQNFGFAYYRIWGAHWLSPTWSLAIEEQFYLILPLIVLVLRRRQLIVLSAFLVIIAPFVRYYLLLKGNVVAATVLLPARWDSLFLGVIGACVFHGDTSAFWRTPYQRLLHVTLLAFLLCGMAQIVWPQVSNGWFSALQPTFLGILSLLFIGFAIFSPWRGFLANRWLVRMGTISYGVYMFHEGIFGLLYALTHGEDPRTGDPTTSSWLDVDVMLLSLAVTLTLAMLSFRYFESPLIHQGRRFRYLNPKDLGLQP